LRVHTVDGEGEAWFAVRANDHNFLKELEEIGKVVPLTPVASAPLPDVKF
jgi:hypothetical protein